MHINREALKAIRQRSGISISELARRADMDRTLVSRIESGERRGSIDQRAALAKGLGVPVGAITLMVNYDEAAA